MKFTLSWLKEHLDTQAPLDTILDSLTQLGLVVEKVENKAEALALFTICEVVEASAHPNADRLKVCRVNTGTEIIQVVCGASNARQGMKAVLARPGAIIPSTGVALKVGNVRGVESFGMMCSGEELQLEETSEGIIEVSSEALVGIPYSEWKGLNEVLIEIDITPNRGDCLGVYGIARDLSAAQVGKLRPLEEIKIGGKFSCPVTLSLKDKACPYFTGRLIRGVKNGPSPEWLRHKLESIGLRSVSTLVDITNYFTFDRGRPLHVFDADCLTGELTIRPAYKEETFVGLDEKKYTLSEGMTVIADGSGVVSLGGIMGGQSTGCSYKTTNVFLESAFFEAVNTAVTGRKLGILSDARFRFERGVDPFSTRPGLEAATQMILELCGGDASEVVEVGSPPDLRKNICWDDTRVKSLGGLAVESETATNTLSALGFEVKGTCVRTPSWRPDIEGEADLVEEILRIEGYEKILPVPYEGRPEDSPLSPLQERRFVYRDKLANRGFIETVTWSFISQEEAEFFGGVAEDLTIVNPISHDLNAMRPTLIPNLLKAVLCNQHRGQELVMLFEVGPQYVSAVPAIQEVMISGLRAGSLPSNWIQKSRPVDFYDVKADLRALIGDKGKWEAIAPSWYHPGRSATIKLGTQVLGYCGDIHPKIVKRLGLRSPIVGFELFVDRIPLPRGTTTAKTPLLLSSYQAVERDFAFLVESAVPADKVLHIARKVDPHLVEDVVLFDVFEKVEGEKSLGVRVCLQSKIHTLEEKDIQAFSEKFVREVEKQLGGTLRG